MKIAEYTPIKTVEDAIRMGNKMAKEGNYPAGLSPCFIAGINGDSPEECLFKGEDFCSCD